MRPLPNELLEMLDFIIDKISHPSSNGKTWRKEVDVSPEFENLISHILKLTKLLMQTLNILNMRQTFENHYTVNVFYKT